MLAGIFTGVTTNGTTPVVIYDPATGSADGTGRTPFLNNVIPGNRISYAAQQMIKLLSKDAPNVAGANLTTVNGVNNDFFGAADAEYVRDNVDTRIDYNLSSKSTIFGRYGF
jgi:hypothetical protein